MIPAARAAMPVAVANTGFAPSKAINLEKPSMPFAPTLIAFKLTASAENPVTAPVSHCGLLTKNSPILITGLTNSPKPSAPRLSFGYSSSKLPINPSEAYIILVNAFAPSLNGMFMASLTLIPKSCIADCKIFVSPHRLSIFVAAICCKEPLAVLRDSFNPSHSFFPSLTASSPLSKCVKASIWCFPPILAL